MASISLTQLVKHYGRTPALRGIDLAVADGEFVALVGPSGCGKSTLLRLIAGLEPITSGDIKLGDRLINDVAPRDRNVAMVFQNYALYPHKSVRENLGFALTLQRVPRDEIRRRVDEVACTLGLAELLDRRPRQLSGGQRQRVAMGRAIIREPQAFLFDEPLSNLDAQLRVQMRTEIRALHQRLRTTSVYVTHDQVEAMSMADRIVVLRDGRIEQVGTPLALYDRPANAFVASFIGSPAINFIPGRLQLDGSPRVRTDDGLDLPLAGAPAGQHGQPVLYGARPEHVVIDAEHGSEAEILVVEPLGSDTHVTLQWGARPVTAALRGRVQARPGDRVPIRPVPAAVHLFDPATGARLS